MIRSSSARWSLIFDALVARALVACALVVCAASPALAQETPQARQDLAAARALFDEGVTFYEAGDLASAADRFRRSLAVREAAAVQYNLATVLERLGQLVEARELFLAVARSEMPETIRTQAQETADAIEPRLARLTVRVDNGPASQLTLGERRLGAAMIDVAVPVDPGAYTLRGETEDGRRSHVDVELAPGERLEVTLAFVPPVTLAEAAPPAPEPSALAAPAASDDALVWAIVLGVVGTALLGAGIGLGVFLEQDRYYVGDLGAGRVSLP